MMTLFPTAGERLIALRYLRTGGGSSFVSFMAVFSFIGVVLGVAALIVAHESRIPMDKLKARIINSVDKLDSLKGKVASGGRICAANAMLNVVKTH